MKKLLLILLIFFITLFTGLSIFANSQFFFHRYIAKNIEQYNFSYSHADGALFEGFSIEDLKYKGEPLASNVELKIAPLRLLSGVISVKKLELVGVRKSVLERVVNDFKPSQSSKSTIDININFELKNILLTIKPFRQNEIDVRRNNLWVSYVSYINNHFNVGEVEYEAKTNLGNINLKGRYENRVLKVENINIEKFDLKRVAHILKTVKSSGDDEYHLKDNPFIPKRVETYRANLSLIPFMLDGIKSKNLNLKVQNTIFDVSKLLFKKARILFRYNGTIAKLDTVIDYKEGNVTVENGSITLYKPNLLESHIAKLLSSKSSTESNNSKSTKIIPIKQLYVKTGDINIEKSHFRGEKIEKVEGIVNNLIVDFNRSRIEALKYFSLNLKSSLVQLQMQASIDNSCTVDYLKLSTNNTDKVIKFIKTAIGTKQDSNSSRSTGDSKVDIPFVPQKIFIRNLQAHVKQLSFKPYIISKGSLKATNTQIDTHSKRIEKGSLSAVANSNWGRASLDGKIKNNNYYANGLLKPNQFLLDIYSIPLRAKNIAPIKVDGRFGVKDFDLNAFLKGKDILKSAKNISILESKNNIKYNYSTNEVVWNMDANATYSPIKRATVKNRLIYKDSRVTYSGLVKSAGVTFVQDPLKKVFDNIVLKYHGDKKELNSTFETKVLKGNFGTRDYKKALLTVKSKNATLLRDFLELPKNLKNLKLSHLLVKLPIDFDRPLPLKGVLQLATNVANLNSVFDYSKSGLGISGDLNIFKNSLLFRQYPQLNKKALAHFKTKLLVGTKKLSIHLNNNLIQTNFNYNSKTSRIDNSKLQLGTLEVKAKGSLDAIEIDASTNSLKRAQVALSKLYKFQPQSSIDGKCSLKATITKFSNFQFTIQSPKIIYNNKKSKKNIENIALKGKYSNNILRLEGYKFSIDGYHIYSNKSSQVDLSQFPLIAIDKLWINNSLSVAGNYELIKKIGKLKFNAANFKLENSDVNLNLFIDTSVALNGQKIAASGVISVLDGNIKKAFGKKHSAESEDIIILQRKRAKESTKFAKNIKLNVKIKSKGAITYSHSGGLFKAKVDLSIVKNYNQLSNFNGSVTIEKNGYYMLNGKRLVVEKGLITFKGKSTAPNLNIELSYKGREYNIKINIMGTPTRPVLNFSSTPYLTKNQILAYLLFDDSSAAGTHDQAAMVNTIGGSIAKSLLGSVGIKIDHISIKDNGFSVGKSLGKNVIIYYNQEENKPSIKARVDIAKSIHTEVEVGQDKQSADIIFSKEY